ncbi:MAG: FAD-binding oxidoreductase [Pseudomonadales bacterium]|nr:FAD-binding oxidoreductase [Pseudomonadales bacterium]
MGGIVKALIDGLGEKSLLLGEDASSRKAGLWQRANIKAKIIVRPRNTEEVSIAMRICHEFDQPIVAHGGLSGLAGGAITTEDDVVISLELMNKIEELSSVERIAVVQSGTVLQTIQEAAEAENMLFPLDLGGRGTCTIGGNISTNAGGNRVIRYGMARNLVLGLEAVLADGTIVSSMNKMMKNNAGYDLKQLFIGTEGSLGIVTRAVLKLHERPHSHETVFVAIDSFPKVLEFLKSIESALGGTMSAFEVLWQNFYQLVTTEPATNKPPLSDEYPYYVLVEAMGGDSDRDHELVENAMAGCFEQGLVADAVIAQNQQQVEDLWAMRDDVAQTRRLGTTFTFDVSMPISKMEAYLEEVNAGLSTYFEDFQRITFGHLGDGNLHLVVSVGERKESGDRVRVERFVYEPLAKIGGSVSAEHGVGLEKKAYLDVSRNENELNLMRCIKKALDPKNLLNRGKIFDT